MLSPELLIRLDPSDGGVPSRSLSSNPSLRSRTGFVKVSRAGFLIPCNGATPGDESDLAHLAILWRGS